MACLLKAPDGPLKGCIVFTTPERDNVIKLSATITAEIASLKSRYVVGLHHNWHDHEFRYDPLYDFSMAGEDYLTELTGRDFARIPLDACNFAPPSYFAPRSTPLWDILMVSRAVNFKGIPEFFQAIRALYDSGRTPRVLFICPLPATLELPGIANLRTHFEAMFNADERKRVVLLTLDWDYPFPFDAETLALFYRNSRIFFHSAPSEHRTRTGSYAWAGGMPVVCNHHVASTLPKSFHRRPFLFSFDGPADMPKALAAALDGWDQPDADWPQVIGEFSSEISAQRVAAFLDSFAATYGWGKVSPAPINSSKLDIRLGRHHGISLGDNRVNLSVSRLCDALLTMADEDLQNICLTEDPELALCDAYVSRHPDAFCGPDSAIPSKSASGALRPSLAKLSKLMGLLRE